MCFMVIHEVGCSSVVFSSQQKVDWVDIPKLSYFLCPQLFLFTVRPCRLSNVYSLIQRRWTQIES